MSLVRDGFILQHVKYQILYFLWEILLIQSCSVYDFKHRHMCCIKILITSSQSKPILFNAEYQTIKVCKVGQGTFCVIPWYRAVTS